GLWQVAFTDSTSAILNGASWAGPTFDGALWNAGANAIKLYDTTNVATGSYLCATPVVGSAPFCTPPSDFGFSMVSANISAITTGLGTFTVPSGSLTGWPRTGIFEVGTGTTLEILCYQIDSSTVLEATCRGYRGTTVSTHTGTQTLTAAAPVVLGVVSTPNE